MSLLEEQIMQARKRAETFARRLDVAKQAEEDAVGGSSSSSSSSGDHPTASAALKHQIQLLASKANTTNVNTSSTNTSSSSISSGVPPPVPATTTAPARQAYLAPPPDKPHEDVSSLEKVIRAQQSDLVRADTELRVLASRNRALQQKVQELEQRLQARQAEDETGRLGAFSDRLGLLQDGQMQAFKSGEYARDLEDRLERSEARCRELLQRLSVSEAVVRNSLDGGEGGSSSSSSSSSSVRHAFAWQAASHLHGGPAARDDHPHAPPHQHHIHNPPAPKAVTGTVTGSVLDIDDPRSEMEAGLRPPAHSSEPSRPKRRKARPASAAAASSTSLQSARLSGKPLLPSSGRGGGRPSSAGAAAKTKAATAGGQPAAVRLSLDKVRRSIKVVVPHGKPAPVPAPPKKSPPPLSQKGKKPPVERFINLSKDSLDTGLSPKRLRAAQRG